MDKDLLLRYIDGTLDMAGIISGALTMIYAPAYMLTGDPGHYHNATMSFYMVGASCGLKYILK